MISHLWLPMNLLLLAYLTSIATALSYIDNTNNTIRYQPATGHQWFISNLIPDYSRCFDGTAIYNQCITENNCHITIPFTGSGIAVYVVQLGSRDNTIGLATHVIITLDATPPTTRTLNQSNIIQYNVTLYDVEGLIWGDHTLDIALVSMVYPGKTYLYATEMAFDYAVVNETSSSPSPSPSTTSTSVSTISSASSSTTTLSSVPRQNHNNTGAIAGGVIGGLVGLLAIAFALLRRRHRRKDEFGSEPKGNPFDATGDNGSDPLPHASTALSYLTDSSFSSIPDVDQARTAVRHSHYSMADAKAEIRPAFIRSRTPSTSTTTQSPYRLSGIKTALRQDMAIPNAPASPTASTSPAPSVIMQKRGRFPINSSLWEAAGPPEQSRPSSTIIPAEPTPLPPELSSSLEELPEEQVDFVRGLLRVNVPMAEIVRVVDIMKEDRKAEGGVPVVGTTDPNGSHIIP